MTKVDSGNEARKGGTRMDGHSPLSSVQEEMIRNIVDHPSAAGRYDSVSCFRLEGAVDFPALSGAVADLIERHSALRTVIRQDGEALLQYVAEPGELDQVTSFPACDDPIAELAENPAGGRYTLADILGGRPLFRVEFHERRSVPLLIIAVNHLIYDGWSIGLLWRDLGEFYAARVQGRPAELPILTTTYAEYATTQREAASALRDAAIDHYRRALGQGPRPVRWPAPREPYAGAPTDIDIMPVVIDGEHAALVREVSKRLRVPPFVVLMTATAMGMSKVCGQPDLLIGVDTANRDDPALLEVVGLFLNTRLVRVHAAPGEGLADVVARVREPWNATAAFGAVYYDEVLAALGNPLFFKCSMPTLSALPITEQQRPKLHGMSVDEVETEVEQSTWRDIALNWYSEGAGFRGELFHRLAAVDTETALEVRSAVLETIAAVRDDPAGGSVPAVQRTPPVGADVAP
ncbi:condensation domain-containing protein [Catenulispora sp. GP43]|uniref:condensation domain-containing protein n=1 Tax=Catenulispora sp. GP43 TaxID=3156263 RepID=UPI0035118CBB